MTTPSHDRYTYDHDDGRKTPRKAAVASWIGSVLEYYDFFIYGTAAALVFGDVFFPDSEPGTATLLSLATFGVGYVARPIGAFFMGHLGDRYGRKRVLVLTMLLMGTATFLVGCLPTYDDIGILAADPARHPPAGAGLRRLRRAGRRELVQPRARPGPPPRVLHELHAQRHADRPRDRDGDVAADRRAARRPVAELGLADPVLAERDRRRRGPDDPPPPRGAARVPRDRRGGDAQRPARRPPARPSRERRPRDARLPGVDRQHDLLRLRARVRRRHRRPRQDDDALGRDRDEPRRARCDPAVRPPRGPDRPQAALHRRRGRQRRADVRLPRARSPAVRTC